MRTDSRGNRGAGADGVELSDELVETQIRSRSRLAGRSSMQGGRQEGRPMEVEASWRAVRRAHEGRDVPFSRRCPSGEGGGADGAGARLS